jgi:hypothetical protein
MSHINLQNKQTYTSFVLHNTGTFYLPSPLTLALCVIIPLSSCVIINKKGVDTLTFRHAGKCEDKISRQSWRRRSDLFKVLLEKE